jgi:hypothetical protein
MEVHVVPGLEPRRPLSTAPAGRPQGPKRFRPDGGAPGKKWGGRPAGQGQGHGSRGPRFAAQAGK